MIPPSFIVKGNLITVGPASRPIEIEEVRNSALLVESGHIKWIGLGETAPDADEVLDFGDRIVTPGLIDAHSHPVFAGNRTAEYERRSQGSTYQQIAIEGGGIRSTMWATRGSTEDQLVEIGKRHLGWMLSNGTTT